MLFTWATREDWPAAHCWALNSFFKFEASLRFPTPVQMADLWFSAASIQNRRVIESHVIKIFGKCGRLKATRPEP
jgi:hypothetical protein